MLREKPFPTDPYTLPQAYQRWLYEDYAYYWTKQTAATKQLYSTAGTRFHLTGFQYWMKYNLKNLPDIIAMWHLDEKVGATARDFSRNANHGTIFGASPSDGLIDGAQLFDGINDYILVPYSPTINITENFTIICFVRTQDNTIAWQRIINRNLFGADQNGDYILAFIDDDVRFYVRFAGAWPFASYANIIQNDTWHALVAEKEGATLRVYVDNVLGPVEGASGTATNTRPLYLGRMDIADQILKGDLDHVIFYNRLLDATEKQRWSERRYPA